MPKYIDRDAFKDKYLCCGYIPEIIEEEFDAFPSVEIENEINKNYTNADMVRSMSDNQLADFLAYIWAKSRYEWYKVYGQALEWLQQTSDNKSK